MDCLYLTTMKKTFIGFNHGQYGDLFIGLTAANVLKSIEPECKLIYSINRKFSDCKEVFLHSKHIDDIVIWDEYDNWPGEKDLDILKNLDNQYANLHIFHPNARHKQNDWYLHRHQTAENCEMHNLPPPTEHQMNFSLNKPDNIIYGNYISVCPFTSFGSIKNLTTNILDKLRDFANDTGVSLVQLGSPKDPIINGFQKFEGTYFESILKMLGSLFLVSADTGMIWASSAYGHPTVGLYAYSFYSGATTAINWMPKNINQISLEANFISNIHLSKFTDAIQDRYNLSRFYRL